MNDNKTGEIEQTILNIIKKKPGLADAELSSIISNRKVTPQCVNIKCRKFAQGGKISRRKRDDGLIGNWLNNGEHDNINGPLPEKSVLTQRKIRQVLDNYLKSQGWETTISRHINGVYLEARRGEDRWLIHLRDPASLNTMALNSFLMSLGEILCRMDNPNSHYSIALPDTAPFRRLWERLPQLARARCGLTALFVSGTGSVSQGS